MDRNIIGCLSNSISRFIHLVACQTTKTIALKDFKNIVGILKILKHALDEAFNSDLPSDQSLIQLVEEFDEAVNEARELVEKLPHKNLLVMQSQPILSKVQNAAIEICHSLSELLQSSSFTSQSAKVKHCLQQLQCIQQDETSELIAHALKDLQDKVIPSLEDVIKIMDNLCLASSQELLLESIYLEKEKLKAEHKGKAEEVECLNQAIFLVTHIRNCMTKLEQFELVNGHHVPPHFRCPLSLQLMLDPVILASGQTYERSFIQNWLDNGLRICPKTHQTLAHTNLISNYTVKALIETWCEINKITLGDSGQPDYLMSSVCPNLSLEGFNLGNDYHDPLHRSSNSKSSFELREEIEHCTLVVADQDRSCFISHLPTKQDSNLQDSILDKKYCHSHSDSVSSMISSLDMASKFDEKASLLGEISHSLCSPLDKGLNSSHWFSPNQLSSSRNGHYDSVLSQSSVSSSNFDELTTSSHVQKLITDLNGQNTEVQSAAASDIRLLSKHNMDNRVLIAKCGAIPSLVALLYSNVRKVQENAVTALLNLSINDNNKALIAEAGAIKPLIHVLECGSTQAKENAAAALFSLSNLEELKVIIGRSDAVKALVNLLGSGSLRGKKDAATALFNLSIFHENKARIVQAGATKYLIELMQTSTAMVDKSLALLANLSTIPEGRFAIVQEGGVPMLVDTVETGSQRGKENAASALAQLCLNSQKFCSLVLQEGAVPPLIALSQFGTPRAKEKAQQILGHFRSQREGTVRKTRS